MGSRILVVDDSLTVRMDLSDALQEAGHEVTAASDLAGARQALDETDFALLVLDVLLPDGDGIELLGQLRSGENTAQLPVMLLSGEDEVGDRVRGFSRGADEYLGKPYDRDVLVRRAADLVRGPGLVGNTVLVSTTACPTSERSRSRWRRSATPWWSPSRARRGCGWPPGSIRTR